MSFAGTLKQIQEGKGKSPVLKRFEAMLDAEPDLERMAGEAQILTRQYFGKTMRLFAPLYVSNECVNICKYCGFSRNNPILRVTLDLDQVEAEAKHLVDEGFRNILLVAGEHPKFVSEQYLEACIRRLRKVAPSVSLEVGPMDTEEYVPLVQAGAEGLVVYQETYNREAYAELHEAGPKRDFDYRLLCPERAYAAGFRRLGIGALFGLTDWKEEGIALAAHAEYLLKQCWKSSLTLSFPRLRPAAGEFRPRVILDDKNLTRLICAFRISFPQVGLVLSTREPVRLRDGLAPLGITMMSAGSHTEPGGYTGVGKESLHRTEKGRMVPIIESEGEYATEQFAISDNRSPQVVVKRLKELGLDPVWKDWDHALAGA